MKLERVKIKSKNQNFEVYINDELLITTQSYNIRQKIGGLTEMTLSFLANVEYEELNSNNQEISAEIIE